ncbi:gag-pol polyprotein [Cucumis melo var. makuwa]|uniref:Gag-pol polyprotein n=1 Tax=Cucumis melo var. makuwa TaxID=1194695 RepID=A0A5D3C0B2_CUCMM|nr:gag-pol polyprotein [Cucumis melo var. makuwa]
MEVIKKVNWTDAEEQAFVGNARTLNAIFNGTTKVKTSRLQLVTSRFEALKMSEDESVAEYNERVLAIANESFKLGEKIHESKIVRKVLRSLSGKFDMKVTAIEEAHDITKLKLDELFGSLLTFEMIISNRENKNGKGGVRHYQAECPTFKRKQKKNFCAILSDEDTDDSEEDDGCTNAFIVNNTETDSVVEDEIDDSEEESENDLSFEQLKIQWKKNSEARAIQKEKI